MEQKEYIQPEIIVELELETEAGSPRPKGAIELSDGYDGLGDGLQ